MAAYMISPLIPYHLGKAGILAVIAAAAGIHLGWLDRTGKTARKFFYLKKALGVALLCGGIIYLLLAGQETGGIRWMPYDQDKISMAAKDKKPLILDFYADWCGPCRAMEKKVFKDPEIVKLSRHFIAMRLDLTHRQPSQDEDLKRFRVRGVPTIIFFNREGVEEKKLRIESYVGKADFLAKMKRLLEISPPFQK
jgi:thiol:disulfide interchange protein DsbD